MWYGVPHATVITLVPVHRHHYYLDMLYAKMMLSIALVLLSLFAATGSGLGLGPADAAEKGDRIGVDHLYGSSPVCRWQYPRVNNSYDYPEVYWINMDSSATRRANMQTHLDKVGFRHFRVKGVSMQDIYIPPDIEATWNHHVLAKYDSSEGLEKFEKSGKQFFLNSLFGRKHKNKLKELGCTMSHLVAMRRAIYSPTATSRYALLAEDDVQFPFDIDFEALAGTAPEGQTIYMPYS
jgi:hypothetical protein